MNLLWARGGVFRTQLAAHGDGHIVLFGFNSFWRGETVGSYALAFDTLLHHGHLDAGQ